MLNKIINKIKTLFSGKTNTDNISTMSTPIITESEVATSEIVIAKGRPSAAEKVIAAVLKLEQDGKTFTPKDVAQLAGVSIPTAKKYMK